jgi:hypothetical protein
LDGRPVRLQCKRTGQTRTARDGDRSRRSRDRPHNYSRNRMRLSALFGNPSRRTRQSRHIQELTVQIESGASLAEHRQNRGRMRACECALASSASGRGCWDSRSPLPGVSSRFNPRWPTLANSNRVLCVWPAQEIDEQADQQSPQFRFDGRGWSPVTLRSELRPRADAPPSLCRGIQARHARRRSREALSPRPQ